MTSDALQKTSLRRRVDVQLNTYKYFSLLVLLLFAQAFTLPHTFGLNALALQISIFIKLISIS